MPNLVSFDVAKSLVIAPAGGLGLVNPGIGTYTSSPHQNLGRRGVKLVIDITAISGGATLTVTLRGRDPVSGKAYTILASAALAAVATTVLTVYPAVAVTANVSANDVLPATWDVTAAVATAGTVTATIGASLLV